MSLDMRSPLQSEGLADVLERILDKGIVIAGDVSVSLVGIELLTIRLRLLIATVDKAREIGINWWERDPNLVGPARAAETPALLERIAGLEQRIADLTGERGGRDERSLPVEAIAAGRRSEDAPAGSLSPLPGTLTMGAMTPLGQASAGLAAKSARKPATKKSGRAAAPSVASGLVPG